jgi:thiol-disulfide isomerase/thioredoxin
MSYKMNLAGGDESSNFMSKIKSAGSAFNSSTIMYIVAAIVFIIVAVFVYYQFVKPALKPSYTANREKNQGEEGNGSKEAELMFFYVDWCPHCKTAKPDWEEVKSEYENKTINGYRIIFTEINCTNESEEVEKLMNKYKIEGYPTIKLLKDGQIIEYDAKPSKDTIIKFLDNVL